MLIIAVSSAGSLSSLDFFYQMKLESKWNLCHVETPNQSLLLQAWFLDVLSVLNFHFVFIFSNPGADNLHELVSAIMQRMGVDESYDHGCPQLLVSADALNGSHNFCL